MAESICRALRDGALEGEYALALTIKDSIQLPFGIFVFNHVLSQLSSNIFAGKSQSRGLVLVAFARSPSFYAELLKSRGHDIALSHKWLTVLDCYTDPLGWKNQLMECGTIKNPSSEASLTTNLCKNVKDLDKLLTSIVQLGKEMVGQEKVRFSVAIDSVSEMLRHTSTSPVASLLNSLRSHAQISCVFWLLHYDLHEVRATAALEYMSSIVGNIEPMSQTTDGQRGTSENLSLLEQYSKRGKIHVRFKRRNGRVRSMSEEFSIEQSGIKFKSIASEQGMVAQSLVPELQFNLKLSEKEQIDRAKVALPFEHQGNGKPIQIYDGRRSLEERSTERTTAAEKSKLDENSGTGEIIYFRDSDDERPDSDEDPDDDLDI